MKFSGILLCSDFDGTLKITSENIAALEYFTDNGGRFTMASGRYPTHFRDAVEGLPINAPVVALNGNAIYDLQTDMLLWSNPMPDALAEEMVRYAAANFDTFQLSLNCLKSGIVFRPHKGDTAEETIRALYAEDSPKPVLKVHVIHTPRIPQEMRDGFTKTFPQVFVSSSGWGGLEMYLPTGGKGSAIRKLRSMLPEIHTVVGIGDWENDLSMIEEADIGYAVANACEELKAAADRITVSVNENAIAKIIDDLDKEY